MTFIFFFSVDCLFCLAILHMHYYYYWNIFMWQFKIMISVILRYFGLFIFRINLFRFGCIFLYVINKYWRDILLQINFLVMVLFIFNIEDYIHMRFSLKIASCQKLGNGWKITVLLQNLCCFYLSSNHRTNLSRFWDLFYFT